MALTFYQQVAALNRELLRMVDFTSPFWNGGARFWLEHRGPALMRAIADAPGLKLWVQAPPLVNLDPFLKTCTLFADHVVIGHSGPLPPYHLGLVFPWHFGEDQSWIPPTPQETAKRTGKAVMYQLRCDAVRRPLPPIAKQCLLGPLRDPISIGMLSYFPASIVYSPLADNRWPSPSEVLARNGKLPQEQRMIGVKKEKASVTESQKQVSNDQGKGLGWEISEYGYPVFQEKELMPSVWEWSDTAIKWEMMMAALVASGGVESPENQQVRLRKLPEAILKLRLPYILDAKWEVIMELKDREKDSLELFRTRVLDACSKINECTNSRRFLSEVEYIQQNIVERSIKELNKSFRNLRHRHWFKMLGLGLAGVVIEVACYRGFPEFLHIFSGGSVVKALDIAFDLQKEEEEWRRRKGSENPMYFIWRIRH